MTQAISTSSCGFWVRHSDSCAIFKKAMVILGIAIGAIALVGGVLSQFVLQGYNLGSFNALVAQYLTQTRVFGLLFGGTFLLTAGVVILCMMVYQDKQKEFTQEEIETLRTQNSFQTKIDALSEDLEGRQYALCLFQKENRKVYAYGLVIKGVEPHDISIRLFRNDIYRRMAIRELQQKHYTNGKKAEYSSFIIGDRYSDIRDNAEHLRTTLSEGEYILRDSPPKLFTLIIRTKNECFIHYYKNLEARAEKLQHYTKSGGYFLKDDVESAKKESFQGLNIQLNPGEYITYSGDIAGISVIFVSYYPIDQETINTCYFRTQESSQQFIQSNLKSDYSKHITDADKIRKRAQTPKKNKGKHIRYSSFGPELTNTFKTVKSTVPLARGQFCIRPIEEEKKALIYWNHKSSERSASLLDENDLSTEIEQLKQRGLIDRDQLDSSVQKCIDSHLLNFQLHNQNDCWIGTCALDGSTLSLLIYKREKKLEYQYFPTDAKRSLYLNSTNLRTILPNSTIDGFHKRKEIRNIKTEKLPQLEPKQFVTLTLKNSEDILYFWILGKHEDATELSHIFQNEQARQQYIEHLHKEGYTSRVD